MPSKSKPKKLNLDDSDIEQKTQTSYKCNAVVYISGKFKSFVPAMLTLTSARELLVQVAPVEGVLIHEQAEKWVRVGSDVSYELADDVESSISIALDPAVERVEASSETFQVVPGSIIRTRRSRTIAHSVDLQTDGIFGVSVKGKMPVFETISAEVRSRE